MEIDRKKIELEIARQKINIPEAASRAGMTPAGLHWVLNTGSAAHATVGRLAAALEVDPSEIIKTEER